MRFDRDHPLDAYHELLKSARERRLTADEVETLAKALHAHQPWLEWAGKQEQDDTFTVDVVPLHIHERVSAKGADSRT